MGFTCILLTNTFLVGRYWDFKSQEHPLSANQMPRLGIKREKFTSFLVTNNPRFLFKGFE